jgi:hypothetical protein
VQQKEMTMTTYLIVIRNKTYRFATLEAATKAAAAIFAKTGVIVGISASAR